MNISYPKDMTGWSQRETKPVVPPETVDIMVFDEIPTADELNFEIMLKNSVVTLRNVVNTLNECYRLKACKEIHDAQIHLSMARDALKRIK